jgi:hypothetical protein
MSLTADPPSHEDGCYNLTTHSHAPTPYPVTLTNHSDVPVTWSFTHVDQITVKGDDDDAVQVPWASFAGPDGKAMGTLSPGASTVITVTPFQGQHEMDDSARSVCSSRPATYSATITGVDALDSSQSATVSFTEIGPESPRLQSGDEWPSPLDSVHALSA